MKKTAIFLLISLLAFATLTGCGNNENTTDAPSSTPTIAPSPTDEPTSTPEPSPTDAPTATPEPSPTDTPTTEGSTEALPTETPTPIPTEPPHEHNYTEIEGSEIAATCTTDGKKADKVCECGEKIEGEVVKATGHTYGEYKSDSNATYDADGTKTAECSVCGEKDTVTDAGSKLERPKEPNLYGMTFEDWSSDKTFYVMENTDIYFEPSLQSPVVGHLSINDEVKIISWASNGSEIYPPYDGTEKPTDISWKYINYNGQTGYVPYDYVWKVKRDTSITLNPLHANYPTVGGGGSGLFYPYEKEWRYVYGCNSRKTIYLHPQLSSVNIYDGIEQNVIATITDSNIKFETTGNAYATYRDDVGSYYIYEIYYNGQIAYIDSLNAIRE